MDDNIDEYNFTASDESIIHDIAYDYNNTHS